MSVHSHRFRLCTRASAHERACDRCTAYRHSVDGAEPILRRSDEYQTPESSHDLSRTPEQGVNLKQISRGTIKEDALDIADEKASGDEVVHYS